MAGGTFDKSIGKIRPGTYINFESSRHEVLSGSDRGTVVIPLIAHTYGPEKEFITISAASPDSAIDKLGCSVYDDEPSMLLIREALKNAGRRVKAVVADHKADYEGIINVTNSVVINGKELTNAQAAAWAAGADASALSTQSNTYKIYAGAEAVARPKTHEQAETAIQNGEFFFSYSENGDVVVEYDINSLTTFTENKDKSYSKNRVLRVLDSFAEAIV